MNIRSAFTRLTQSVHPVHPVISYALLVFLLLFLADSIWWRLTPPGSSDSDYTDLFTALLLLFGHLVFMFKWPRCVAFALGVLASSWTGFFLLYVYYLRHAFRP
jgi:hypothetical protein